jgi:hypothetical protein
VAVQLGGIISANIYRDDDKPLYKRGNRVLLGINVLAIALFIFAKVYYVVKNKIRDRKWNAMTPQVCFRSQVSFNCRLLGFIEYLVFIY